MKVLIVDDDLGSRLVAQAAVERLGHAWRSASDGDAAWQAWQDFQPDVLISDRAMPGLDGLELCRRIRETERTTYTYIVLLTASDGNAEILNGLESGADDYVVKPLDPFILRARLLVARRVTSLHAELGRIRQELAAQAGTDPLTNLKNRLRLIEDLEMLHTTSQRYQRPYTLALCDIDHFKLFNDTYGHQAGDTALRAVADALTQHTRQSDGLYRYGGEEFLLLMPEQSAASAAMAMERFRAALFARSIDHSNAPAGVLTCSIGIATFIPGSGQSSEQLMKQADDSLYRAKATGRNQVASTATAEHIRSVT